MDIAAQLARGHVDSTAIQDYVRTLGPHNITAELVELFSAPINLLITSPDYYELDPSFAVIELYEALLSHYDAHKIHQMYPDDQILATLDYKNQFSLLVVRLLNTHSSLVTPEILFKLVSLYLGDPELMVSLTAQIERLLQNLSSYQDLQRDEYRQLYENAKSDAILISRLMELVSLATPQVQFDLSFDLHSDDILLVALILDFYRNMLAKGVEIPVQSVFQLNEPLLQTDVVNVVAQLSYSFPHHEIPTDLQLQALTKINPAVVDRKVVEETENLFTKRNLPILLNLVKYEPWVQLIDFEPMKSLSIDLLFQLLVELSATLFGSALVLQYPSIVNEYLVDQRPVNNEIFALKAQVLENLLARDSLVYEEGLRASYALMRNGRSLEPGVAVAHQAA